MCGPDRGRAARCAGTRARRTLAALTIGLFAWLRTDISRLDKRIDDLRQEIGDLRAEMDGRLRAVEHGQARLEGLLEGLREAIAGRSAA